MGDVQQLVKAVVNGELSGGELKDMVERNEISKTERRRIAKLAKSKKIKLATMTERQKLRMEVKEKKMQPKLSQDDRNAKFRKSIEDDREKEQANFTTCLNCRKRGHFLKDCPKLKGKAAVAVEEPQAAKGGVFCYNCGSYGHALRHCSLERDPNGHLPFASCFICKQNGHLARSCPNNSHGLYPKGGCCHICGKIDHLARDCPEKPAEPPADEAPSSSAPEEKKAKKRAFAEVQKEGVSDDAMATEFNGNNDDDHNDNDEDYDEDKDKKKKKKNSKKQKR